MSDRFFYPFIVLLVAAIVSGALFVGGPLRAPALSAEQIESQGYLAEGEDLRGMVNSPGTSINFALNSEGKVSNAILSAHLTKAAAPPSAGVFVTLGPNYEKAFGGKKIQLTVRAKAGADNPSDSFAYQYFTAAVGDSPQQIFELTGEYEDDVITFNPRPPSGEPGSDYIGMWPDLTGNKRTMDLQSISVKVMD